MLSSHSQLARTCRALCMAATLALLPQGQAWAGRYDVSVDVEPPDGDINSLPFPITVTVTPQGVSTIPTGAVLFSVNLIPVGQAKLDQNGIAAFALEASMVSFKDNNVVWATYEGDGCFYPGWGRRAYYVDILPPHHGRLDRARRRATAKSARTRGPAALTRGAAAREARPAQRELRLTNTILMPVTSPGQTIDLTAEVTDCQVPTVDPTGTVTFLDKDSKPLGNPAPVLLKVAKFTISTDQLAPGDNLLTASFKGTNGFGDSSGTASVTVPPSAKTKAKAVSPPRAYHSGRSPGKPRHDLRPQAPPGRGMR